MSQAGAVSGDERSMMLTECTALLVRCLLNFILVKTASQLHS